MNAFTDAGNIAVCNIITLSVGETSVENKRRESLNRAENRRQKEISYPVPSLKRSVKRAVTLCTPVVLTRDSINTLKNLPEYPSIPSMAFWHTFLGKHKIRKQENL